MLALNVVRKSTTGVISLDIRSDVVRQNIEYNAHSVPNLCMQRECGFAHTTTTLQQPAMFCLYDVWKDIDNC